MASIASEERRGGVLAGQRRLLGAYFAPQRGRITLLAALIAIDIALRLANPQIVRRFIDAAEAGGPLSALTFAGIAYLLIGLAARIASLAATYASVLGARTVLRERSHIGGVYRIPDMEVLWGDGTETVHLENGILYKLDAARLMFSSGNIDEKLRMAALDCRGEIVVDMFAGIGYFTLPLALHARASKVISCEINPLAFHYLCENVQLNGLESVVEPVLGDNRDLPGKGIADRVVMGYVRTTAQHLCTAFRLVRKGGTIHYQDTFPLEVFPEMAWENLASAADGRSYEVRLMKEVKSYSPGVSHMVLDVAVLD
mgnify:CR=1 FL=1